MRITSNRDGETDGGERAEPGQVLAAYAGLDVPADSLGRAGGQHRNAHGLADQAGHEHRQEYPAKQARC